MVEPVRPPASTASPHRASSWRREFVRSSGSRCSSSFGVVYQVSSAGGRDRERASTTRLSSPTLRRFTTRALSSKARRDYSPRSRCPRGHGGGGSLQKAGYRAESPLSDSTTMEQHWALCAMFRIRRHIRHFHQHLDTKTGPVRVNRNANDFDIVWLRDRRICRTYRRR